MLSNRTNKNYPLHKSNNKIIFKNNKYKLIIIKKINLKTMMMKMTNGNQENVHGILNASLKNIVQPGDIVKDVKILMLLVTLCLDILVKVKSNHIIIVWNIKNAILMNIAQHIIGVKDALILRLLDTQNLIIIALKNQLHIQMICQIVNHMLNADQINIVQHTDFVNFA